MEPKRRDNPINYRELGKSIDPELGCGLPVYDIIAVK